MHPYASAKKGRETVNRFQPFFLYLRHQARGVENGSEFGAQRSMHMHIPHMHIPIIMEAVYLMIAPPFQIRVVVGLKPLYE